jgi:hypothetical protein
MVVIALVEIGLSAHDDPQLVRRPKLKKTGYSSA